MSWLPHKLVVVPIDFSGKSVTALTTALELVESPEHVHAIHIVPPLDNMAPGSQWGIIDDESRQDSVVRHFDKFLAEHGVEHVTTIVQLGDPGMQIAEYASTHKADLIVISSHGYQGVKRMLLGSVTERVIRHADCGVLVLRREDAQ
jgi:nucleotide-binding universal stress UspA family protein